jgi:hypothetical protein
MITLWGRLATCGPIVNRSIRAQPGRLAQVRNDAKSNFDRLTTNGSLQRYPPVGQVPDLPSGQSQATCEVGWGHALPSKDNNK